MKGLIKEHQKQQKALKKANNHRINRLAKAYLEQEGVTPDPSLLYILQLGKWALEKGKIDMTPTDPYGQLPEMLERLLYLTPPEKVMKILRPAEIHGKNSFDLAMSFLDDLDSWMTAHLEDYPRARTLP